MQVNKHLLHGSLQPVGWLVGRWVGENGIGEYPTITPFTYCEEIEFISNGNPALNYSSKTWHPTMRRPMHSESGFLRIKPATNQVAFVISHSFGLSEVEEGEAYDDRLTVRTKDIVRMSFTKNPAVTEIQRKYVLEGDHVLHFTLSMATTNTPLRKHLSISYKRAF